MKPDSQTTDRMLRDKISEIFVKNGLPTHQVAIGEIWELTKNSTDVSSQKVTNDGDTKTTRMRG